MASWPVKRNAFEKLTDVSRPGVPVFRPLTSRSAARKPTNESLKMSFFSRKTEKLADSVSSSASGFACADSPENRSPPLCHKPWPPRRCPRSGASRRAGCVTVDLSPLEEKVPFFGKAQLEPGQVDLLLVGFDGGKIRVDREVPRNRLGERVAGVQAGLRPDCIPILELAHDVGDDLEPLRGPLEVQAGEESERATWSGKSTRPCQHAFSRRRGNVRASPRPQSALFPAYISGSRVRWRSRRSSPFLSAGRQTPDTVPGRVGRQTVVGDPSVGLRAQEIGHKLVAGPPIRVCVDVDHDGVILFEVGIPLGDPGGDPVQVGIGVLEAEVNGLVVVEDPYRCLDRGRGSPLRLELEKTREDRGPSPDGLIQDPSTWMGSRSRRPSLSYNRLRRPAASGETATRKNERTIFGRLSGRTSSGVRPPGPAAVAVHGRRL